MIIISLETNRSALGPGGLFATQDVGQTFAWLLKNTLKSFQTTHFSIMKITYKVCGFQIRPGLTAPANSTQEQTICCFHSSLQNYSWSSLPLRSLQKRLLATKKPKKREKSSQNFQTSPEIVGFKGHASPSRTTLHKFPLHKRPGRNTLPSERNLKQEFDTNRQRAELLEYGLWIDKSVWPQYHLTF